MEHARARQTLEADPGKERNLANLKGQRLLLAEYKAATLRKEVEGLRTFAGQAVEEAERGLDEVERLLKADANAAFIGVWQEEEAKSLRARPRS